MEVARNTALLATGKLPEPRVAKSIAGELAPVIDEPLSVGDHQALPKIRKAMIDVAAAPFGTASKYLNTPVLVGAKTGTAQVVGIPQDEKQRMQESELEYYQRSHAWLTTYAPASDPEYVVIVLIEHGGHGGNAAGPIVSRIYDKMEQLGYFR